MDQLNYLKADFAKFKIDIVELVEIQGKMIESLAEIIKENEQLLFLNSKLIERIANFETEKFKQ
jgi:regulator of replication initiation timing